MPILMIMMMVTMMMMTMDFQFLDGRLDCMPPSPEHLIPHAIILSSHFLSHRHDDGDDDEVGDDHDDADVNKVADVDVDVDDADVDVDDEDADVDDDDDNVTDADRGGRSQLVECNQIAVKVTDGHAR